MTLQEILDRLNRPDVVVERLLEECRSPDKSIWEMHSELYTEFTQKLIEQGHPGRALELAREWESHLKDHSRLQYQLALAAVRGGSTQYAESLLEPLLKKVTNPDPEANIPADIDGKLWMDIVALKVRILKDCTRRDPSRAKESAEFAGQHVNRAARIEAVTVRGCAYASEPFAAILTMRCQKQFVA